MRAHRDSGVRAAAFGCGLLAAIPAAAQTIRDDFSGPQLSPETWFVCHRDENEFAIVPVPDQGFNAARTTVHERLGTARPGASGAHTACADERGAYARDAAQRAELWEEDALHLPVGTEVWYQFAMFIDPSVSPRHGHLVIGQWKQRGGNSPFVAQRFRGRSFTITIEQDDRSPGRTPDKTQCRILVASDRDVAQAGPPVAAGAAALASAAHGEVDRVPTLAPKPSPQRLPGCATDLKVERFGSLPSPFGRWTTMRYRIKATAADDGVLEIWADGRPVVKVTGRFGYADNRASADQYFKFGPYREPAEGSIYAMIARFRRGATLHDVAGD